MMLSKGLDNFISNVMNTSIDYFCDLNGKSQLQMKYLMDLNLKEHNMTLDMLNHSNGGKNYAMKDSTLITNDNAIEPTYVEGNNYREYSSSITLNSKNGINTNRSNVDGKNNYTQHNQLYSETVNLYPDDNDSGWFADKWNVGDNKNSLLYKTKKLFEEHKINTIISRFHTDNEPPEGKGDIKSVYGLSHGRNLLTKKAENGDNSYNVNGYTNPYCRVWTHHYQYDSLYKLIRPFANVDNDGVVEVTKVKDFHKWANFKLDSGDGSDWGWKDETNNGWEKTVLGDNGFPKITPLYGGGGKNNLHTKDCMFSIENLAWQGYDPYSFEKALSWEQRGPMGGRIMWFPPYGISFNETTSVNWNANTFIGRGEDVYTYTNTVRQGTLNFMLVVDHPSIIDYVSWDDVDHSKAEDTDLLRFFAGCDGGNTGNSVSNKGYDGGLAGRANPTPLTDEYIQNEVVSVKVEENKPAPQVPQEPEIPDTEPRKIEFYVFYPNNYSGVYDTPGSTVEAIAYLLSGVGAQKQEDPLNTEHPKDIDIKFDDLYLMSGKGYEMNGSGLSIDDKDENNYIVGTSPNWRFAPNRTKYVDVITKKWYYRIDGNYDIPPKSKWNVNTYDQTLLTKTNYSDSNSFGLNSDVNEVKHRIQNEMNNDNLYSLAEIAAALTKNEKVLDKIVDNSSIDINSDRFEELKSLLTNNNSITKLTSIGFSNSHGNNTKSVNDERNNNLAKQRAKTVVDWLIQTCKLNVDNIDIDTNKFESGVQVDVKDEKNINGISAKIARSAKVIIELTVNKTSKLSEIEQVTVDEDGTENKDNTRFIGWKYVKTENGVEYYQNTNENDKDKQGKLWYYDEASGEMKYGDNKVYDRSNYGNFRKNRGNNGTGDVNDGDNSFNKVRYDQEYHFFKKLESTSPTVFSSLMEKIKYFDPAFHSMTPEGFNARLTFLNQCTRQGNTVGASDGRFSKSANNLAFGRPPYCVLRLGDFYNQMIVIDNISISYDPLVWDLNTEGAGVQPLLANISITFKFIGGGDMGGAVRRLQNAMSFNYYANTSLYDNRADRVEYNFDWKEGGAVNHDLKNGYFYNPQMYKKN